MTRTTMIQAIQPSANHIWTAEELAARFGPIPLNRIRFDPPPGLGTEEDVVEIEAREQRLYELIDGVLLEKDMGYYESILAVELITLLNAFVRQHNLGIVAGEGGMLKFAIGLIYIPDISFVSWQQLGTQDVEHTPVPPVIPDLAIEVISRGNTRREMEAKLDDYFAKGVRLVWYLYPTQKEIHIYTTREQFATLRPGDTLTGGDVLPGFEADVTRLFTLPQNPNKE